MVEIYVSVSSNGATIGHHGFRIFGAKTITCKGLDHQTYGKTHRKVGNNRKTIGKPWENGGLPSGNIAINKSPLK